MSKGQVRGAFRAMRHSARLHRQPRPLIRRCAPPSPRGAGRRGQAMFLLLPLPALRGEEAQRAGEGRFSRNAAFRPTASPTAAPHPALRATFSPQCGGRGRAMYLLLPLPALRGENAQRAGEGRFSRNAAFRPNASQPRPLIRRCAPPSPRIAGRRGRAMFLLLPLPALRGEDAQRAGEGRFSRDTDLAAEYTANRGPSSGAARHLLPAVRGEGER